MCYYILVRAKELRGKWVLRSVIFFSVVIPLMSSMLVFSFFSCKPGKSSFIIYYINKIQLLCHCGVNVIALCLLFVVANFFRHGSDLPTNYWSSSSFLHSACSSSAFYLKSHELILPYFILLLMLGFRHKVQPSDLLGLFDTTDINTLQTSLLDIPDKLSEVLPCPAGTYFTVFMNYLLLLIIGSCFSLGIRRNFNNIFCSALFCSVLLRAVRNIFIRRTELLLHAMCCEHIFHFHCRRMFRVS